MANVSGQPRVVRLHCEPYERNGTAGVLVEVEDAGMGFGGTDPAQLYDALYTTKPDGLGMGLSIARSIVEGYGGRLWATANPGHGVTFHFTTPIRPRP